MPTPFAPALVRMTCPGCCFNSHKNPSNLHHMNPTAPQPLSQLGSSRPYNGWVPAAGPLRARRPPFFSGTDASLRSLPAKPRGFAALPKACCENPHIVEDPEDHRSCWTGRRRWVDYCTSSPTGPRVGPLSQAHPWQGTHPHSVAMVQFRQMAFIGPGGDSQMSGVARSSRLCLTEAEYTHASASTRAPLL